MNEVTKDAQEILNRLVTRLVRLGEPTDRRALRVTLKGKGDVLQGLISDGFLIQLNNDLYFPGILAFENCGDSFLKDLGRSSLGIVLHCLQNLYRCNPQKDGFTPQDIREQAQRIYDLVEDEQLPLGIFLVTDAHYPSFLTGWTIDPSGKSFVLLRVHENIVDFNSAEETWDQEIRARRAQHDSMRQALMQQPPPQPFSFVTDQELQMIIERDYRELLKLRSTHANKSRIVLAGGLIEALLLYSLQARETNAKESEAAKQHKMQNKALEKWGLAALIDCAVELSIIDASAQMFNHSVREYRNLIHPGREKLSGLKVAPEEADIAQSVLEIVIRELSS